MKQLDKSSTHAQAGQFLRYLLVIVVAASLVFVGFLGGAGTALLLSPRVQDSVADLVGDDGAVVSTKDGDWTRDRAIPLLEEINGILQDEYFEQEAITDDALLYGAASGMVGSLGDPYTLFVEPAPASVLAEDMTGSFEGIGATVNMADGQLIIVEPLENSPALEAGLQRGDIVLEVDDQSLEGMGLMEAIALIRGPSGTIVKLLIQREGVAEPFVVPVERARVEHQTVRTEMLEHEIAYLWLSEFNAVSDEKMREGLEDLLSQDPNALILDLRGNPGGYLTRAIDVASEFLPRDSVVTVERWSDGSENTYRVTRKGVALDIPMVILIDGGSASASEIVAGALRDYDRALLIGQPTAGKGSVQNVHQLSDGSSLRVTIAKFYLPLGESTHFNPIQPDISVEFSAEQYEAGADPQLDAAVEYLLSETSE